MGLMSKYIFGIHDAGPWFDLVRQAGKTAWCVYTEEIGHDPSNHAGKDFRSDGITPIVRLNNAYGKGHGTIPTPDEYADFAQRCANFVAASRGLQYVVIGNEIALEWEWPTDEPIRLVDYVQCYRLCYDAIKRVNANVMVAPAAVAPWNDSTPDAPDWIMQLPTMLNMLSSRVDWICLHAYTRRYGADAFATGARMNPPYAHRYSEWETLWEFMQAIPQAFRRLPVMITEANGNGPWPAENTGWIRAMYASINWWNQQTDNQRIRAACLFRWLLDDKQWSMAHSPGAAEDFRLALAQDYQARGIDRIDTTNGAAASDFPKSGQVATALKVGDRVAVVAGAANVRNAPGLQAEVALKLTSGSGFVVEAIYVADGLIWLQGPHGWVAEVAPDGTRLVSSTSSLTGPSTGSGGDEQAAIVRRLAAEYGIDERLAVAVIAVESGGSGFRDGRVILRFEPHVFIAKVGALFRQRFSVGEPAWAGKFHLCDGKPFHGDQDAEYSAQAVAVALAEQAAAEAASYGLGQIMGFNYATCGYTSADEMRNAFGTGIEPQIRAMFEYFKNRKDKTGQSCIDYLRAGDLVNFAALYNGPGQAEHYAGLIRQRL